MRLLSIILSIYVLVLSVYPCCQEGQENDKTEITSIAHIDGDNNTDMAIEGDFCSPFVGCHCCYGFTLVSPTQALAAPNQQNQTQQFFYSANVYNIFLPIWQPPKLG